MRAGDPFPAVPSRRKRAAKRIAITLAVLVVLFFVGSLAVVMLLTKPDRTTMPSPSTALHARDVSFSSRSGALIKGWFSAGAKARGAVLLLHGVHADRTSMLSRAEFLVAAGYSILMIDFQAEGESSGDAITFGYRESFDVIAAVDELRQLAPGEKIGVIGTSMGGAALLLAEPRPNVDAVVLEQVYPTIVEALGNRLHLYLGGVGSLVEPLLQFELGEWLRLTPQQLRPIDRIGTLHAPLLLIGGDADEHTTLAQSQALFAAASEPKTLWIVPGARHVDLCRYAGDDYRRRILAFFDSYLHSDATQDSTAHAIPSAATSTMRSISSGVMQNGGMK